MHSMESCPSGRRSTIGNRVGAESVSRVQIPDSPPANPHGAIAEWHRVFTSCGGVAEWLNAAVSKTVNPLRGSGVRIPPPPPAMNQSAARRFFHGWRRRGDSNTAGGAELRKPRERFPSAAREGASAPEAKGFPRSGNPESPPDGRIAPASAGTAFFIGYG